MQTNTWSCRKYARGDITYSMAEWFTYDNLLLSSGSIKLSFIFSLPRWFTKSSSALSRFCITTAIPALYKSAIYELWFIGESTSYSYSYHTTLYCKASTMSISDILLVLLQTDIRNPVTFFDSTALPKLHTERMKGLLNNSKITAGARVQIWLRRLFYLFGPRRTTIMVGLRVRIYQMY